MLNYAMYQHRCGKTGVSSDVHEYLMIHKRNENHHHIIAPYIVCVFTSSEVCFSSMDEHFEKEDVHVYVLLSRKGTWFKLMYKLIN